MSVVRDRRLKAIVLLASIAVLAGCASAKFIPTRETFPAKPEDCALEVFTSKPPARAYVEIGLIEGKGMLGAESFEDVLPEMIKKACVAGGDALIIISSDRVTSISGGDDFIGSSEELNAVGTVIVWTDEN